MATSVSTDAPSCRDRSVQNGWMDPIGSNDFRYCRLVWCMEWIPDHLITVSAGRLQVYVPTSRKLICINADHFTVSVLLHVGYNQRLNDDE